MVNKKLSFFVIFLCSVFIFGCGGGSSGTAIGGSGDFRKFSGVVVAQNGNPVSAARVALLNTNDATTTDEAGAFEFSTNYPGNAPTIEVTAAAGGNATVSVNTMADNSRSVELSILFDQQSESAQLLDLTLRAKIVGNCSPFFLNTRTIRQTSPITEGLPCTIEADFRKFGLPANELVFQLQHRECSVDAPWQFSAANKTGSSGPGVGEIDFKFRNDEKHCVYRIVGPTNSKDTVPLSAQLNTLRKEQFDKEE